MLSYLCPAEPDASGTVKVQSVMLMDATAFASISMLDHCGSSNLHPSTTSSPEYPSAFRLTPLLSDVLGDLNVMFFSVTLLPGPILTAQPEITAPPTLLIVMFLSTVRSSVNAMFPVNSMVEPSEAFSKAVRSSAALPAGYVASLS